jgi:hypothetical protein
MGDLKDAFDAALAMMPETTTNWEFLVAGDYIVGLKSMNNEEEMMRRFGRKSVMLGFSFNGEELLIEKIRDNNGFDQIDRDGEGCKKWVSNGKWTILKEPINCCKETRKESLRTLMRIIPTERGGFPFPLGDLFESGEDDDDDEEEFEGETQFSF